MDKIQIIEKLFSYLLNYSYLLLPLFFLFQKKKNRAILVLLAVYGILFFLFFYFFDDIPRSYRKLQQTILTTLEYSFFAFFILDGITVKRSRQIIIICSALFILFQILYHFKSRLGRVDSIAVGVETILIFVYASLYFYQYFKQRTNSFIATEPHFWIIVGVLLYLGSTFFFNILVNHVNYNQVKAIWHFTFIPEILKNIFFVVAMFYFQTSRVKTTKTSSTVPNLDMV